MYNDVVIYVSIVLGNFEHFITYKKININQNNVTE
jgi:hypothetical protein